LVIESIQRDKPIVVVSVCLDAETRNQLEKALHLISGVELVADFQQYLGGTKDLELVHAVKSDVDVCVVDFDRDRAGASGTAEQ
jgi:hypothetical protein